MLKDRLSPKVQRLLDLRTQNDPTAFWGSREMFILFGAILFITAVFFLWAKYIRKPKSQSLRVLSSSKVPNRILRDKRDRQTKSRRWKKRNPTLAETGGLPPTKNGSASN